MLPVGYTHPFLPQLVADSTTLSAAAITRTILGRLPYQDRHNLIPPLARHELDRADHDPEGYFEYARIAELLEHLGLYPELTALLTRAAASTNPDTQDITELFDEPMPRTPITSWQHYEW